MARTKEVKKFSKEWSESKLAARAELDARVAAETVAKKQGVTLDNSEETDEE